MTTAWSVRIAGVVMGFAAGHDAVACCNRNGGNQKNYMDSGLRQNSFFVIGMGIDKGLEQVDGRNADYRGGELDFEH